MTKINDNLQANLPDSDNSFESVQLHKPIVKSRSKSPNVHLS